MAKTIQKIQKKMQKVWLKLLKACSTGNLEKQEKYQKKLIELEIEKKK